jgi:hypothetical protein
MMQAFNPPQTQSDHQQNYGGHLPAQPADASNQIDHSTHLLLIIILSTLWQLISLKIVSSMKIINNIPLRSWKSWSTRVKVTTGGSGNA